MKLSTLLDATSILFQLIIANKPSHEQKYTTVAGLIKLKITTFIIWRLTQTAYTNPQSFRSMLVDPSLTAPIPPNPPP